ncbi:TIGR03016 family PEP-CTERM system-associated outer membrane protein [Geobacter sp. OR-1]|uniref:TIGR03016 family PEP-CTERM system-associated outer membrane protein n=1 Tax=Geobacter sp. OR-1 TaxID=1266765 RepID=UPI000693D9EB|nr:TIGR03016 family PEP-CTERM system-associated outer membrane protein [Geobacter sp. OR-1]
MFPVISEAAEFEIKPRIAVSGEYTDRVDEAATIKQEEYITRVLPGFSLKYHAPRLDLNSSYNFDYRHYAKGTRGDEYTHNLNASTNIVVIENLFFIEGGDTYKRVSLDVARDNTNESLFVNQSDQNIGTVSPNFVFRVGNNSSIKTGYRYTNTWYKEPSGVDKREHYAFVDASHEVLEKFSLTWGYSFSDTDTSIQQYKRHNAYGGFRYEYAEKSFLFGQAGNSWQSFNNHSSVSNLYWNAGLTHGLSFATVTLETKVQYTEDPLRSSIKETIYTGRLARNFARGSVEISSGYSEFEILETGVTDRKRITVAASGKYELVDSLVLAVGVLGEHFTRTTATDYPYRLTGNTGLTYSFNNDLSLSLNYSHITYRYNIPDTSSSKDINRVILEVAKSF